MLKNNLLIRSDMEITSIVEEFKFSLNYGSLDWNQLSLQITQNDTTVLETSRTAAVTQFSEKMKVYTENPDQDYQNFLRININGQYSKLYFKEAEKLMLYISNVSATSVNLGAGVIGLNFLVGFIILVSVLVFSWKESKMM